MKQTNAACWRAAQKVLVGGVNSPVRSFKAVSARPFFVDRGRGPYLWDVEGKRYIDFVGSWGALILGHRHPAVIQAVKSALEKGTTFGTPTPWETQLAQGIRQAIPSMEQVRFVSSGTEAVMSAVRLARAATGRSKILKFDGAYHGHLDALLTRAGSGVATLGIPGTPGVPVGVTQDTITVPFNDLEAVRHAIRRHGRQIACILVEPVLANIGVIAPQPGFLRGLKRLAEQNKSLLIFDEVITGFRVGFGGAQKRFGVRPDLTILGKVIGGGFPIGAYGGARKLMCQVAPSGPVYQAGTLAGHPLAMAAGLTTLKVLKKPGTYQRLEQAAQMLQEKLLSVSQEMNIPICSHQIGGLVSFFFSEDPIRNADQARKANAKRYGAYFRKMLAQGIYMPPSAFEGWFLSTAHTEKEIQKTVQAHRNALKGLPR